MTNFIVIEKDSLNKSTVNATQITLTEASIVHTKMSRDDVDEFIRDGNNLVLKLKNGEVVVIENFFITYNDVASDLVFEEDGCVLYWFDGVSGFKGIPGLEALLPAVEGSQLVGLLPWLVGAAVVGGAAAIIDHNDKDKTESIPNGTNTLKVNTDGTVTGKTENIPEGTDVKINISGKDKDGNNIEYQDIVKVDKDGNYVTDVPPNFADGDLVVESEVIDRNGNTITAEDKLGTGKTDDPATPGDESEGLDREPGSITVEIVETGLITGTTTDVAPGTNVVLTITGKDSANNPVTEYVSTFVKADGTYEAKISSSTKIADGSALTVDASTVDRNGENVTDSVQKGSGIFDLIARDDSVSILEGAQPVTGNVLTNDNSGLTVTGITIGQNSYAVGESVTISGVGTINVAANGAYTFTPLKNYGGDVPSITYTVTNGTTTDSANLKIAVNAIAEQPLVGTFGFSPLPLSLNMQTWSNAKNINGYNLLQNGGSGAADIALRGAIDYLRTYTSVKNSDGSNVTTIGTTETTSLSSSNLPTYDAVYISGFVFLEAGQNYIYSGIGDDSASIIIGDSVSSLHVNWRGTTTSGNGEFSVNQSGYYSFQFYIHNADGVGNYNFAVNNADGSPMNYYKNVAAIESSLQNTTYVLGGYNAGTNDASNDTGFYTLNRGYSGQSSDVINLTGIDLKATDIDGSEYLSFEVSGLPQGAILTFVDANNVTHSLTADANGKVTYIPSVIDNATLEYKDFKLIVGSKNDDVLDIVLKANSIEQMNGDFKTSTLEFKVNVTDAPIISTPADDLITTGTGDDTIVYNVLNAADDRAGNGTDTWLDYQAADKIEFAADFFDGLLPDRSNLNQFIDIVPGSGNNSVLVIDRDGNAGNYNPADLLVIQNQPTLTLQDLLNNDQIVIG